MKDMLGGLYNTDILSLSATLRDERLNAPDGTARTVSKLCGSEVEADVAMKDGHVSDIALRVEACALGQASAAILREAVIGASGQEVQAGRDALWAMLKDGGDSPSGRFGKLALLQSVRDYPARHQSVMLAWDSVLGAMAAAKDGNGVA